MSSTKSNIVANYLGSGWTAIMSLVFIPQYIKYLGMESYALIGIYAMLQVWLFMLDAGLTSTLSREMARFKGGAHTSESILQLLKAMEWVFVIIAVIIIFSVFLLSSWLANDWLKLENISAHEVQNVLLITGIVISFRWLAGLYRSGINGLQNQVILNVLIAFFATLRGFGVLVILKYISPTIQAFFIYQGVVAFVEFITFRYVMFQNLPTINSAIPLDLKALQSIRKFAGGILLITFLATFLTQADKLILSKLMTLSEFGHYVLASTVASGLFFMVHPISSSIRPKLAQLVAANQFTQTSDTYHKFSQLITVLIVPVGLVIAVFSDHLMLLWTRDVEITKATSLLISILVLGNILNGLMNGPYALQLAFGRTRLVIWANLIALLVVIPALWISVQQYGAVAAALVWLIINISYLLVMVPVMHKSILHDELRRWYLQDTILPSASAFLVIIVVCSVAPQARLNEPLASGFILISALALSILASIFTTNHCRNELLLILSNLKCNLIK